MNECSVVDCVSIVVKLLHVLFIAENICAYCLFVDARANCSLGRNYNLCIMAAFVKAIVYVVSS